MSINPLPFARLTALAGVLVLLTGLAMGIIDRDAGTPASASSLSVGELGGLVYQVPEARALDPGNPVDAENHTRQTLDRGQETTSSWGWV